MPVPSSDVTVTDGGITISSGLYDTEDGIKLQANGDTHPRVHLTPQGEVLQGGGTSAPSDLLAKARASATPQTPVFTDTFTRANGDLGPGWINANDVYPNDHEPLGIYDNGVVCTDPMTRSGTYDEAPVDSETPGNGKLYTGIGHAWRETGSKAVSVEVTWTGDRDTAGGNHVEGAPMVHVTPESPLNGFGVWPTTLLGTATLLAGYLGNPVEDFDTHSVAAIPGDPASGTEMVIRIDTDGAGVANVYVDDVLITSWVQQGVHVGTGTDLTIDSTLTESTLHGFAVDAHYTTTANIPTSKGVEAITITALDAQSAASQTSVAAKVPLAGGSMTGNLSVTGVGKVAVGTDGSVGTYPDDEHANAGITLGDFFGTPLIGMGPSGGGTAADAFLRRTAADVVGSGTGGAGQFEGGHKLILNAQTGTAYTAVLGDHSKLVTRSNASASTMTWPQDSDVAFDDGDEVQIANIGAGTVTHSAGTGASVITGSTTSQTQGMLLTAKKVAADTWLIG